MPPGRVERMRLYGIPVTEEDCRTLVDLLLRVGRADDLTAAATIEHGLEAEAELIALPLEQRDAILGVLTIRPRD